MLRNAATNFNFITFIFKKYKFDVAQRNFITFNI